MILTDFRIPDFVEKVAVSWVGVDGRGRCFLVLDIQKSPTNWPSQLFIAISYVIEKPKKQLNTGCTEIISQRETYMDPAVSGNNVVDINKLRQDIFDYVKLRLGDKMITVELEPEHYQNALQRSIEVFRTRSSAAVEESYAFLTTVKDVQVYTMPEEVQYVRQIWRRSLGDLGNAGTQIDPFSQGYLNVYILNSGRAGGVLNYELFKDYEFQVDRMFGGQIDFNYNSITKKLSLIRRPYGTYETLLLWTYNLKPEVQLLTDYRSLTFIKEYTYALCLSELGHAREKFAQIPGPGGGTTLNGSALKAEAKELMDGMHQDISNFRFGETPTALIIG